MFEIFNIHALMDMNKIGYDFEFSADQKSVNIRYMGTILYTAFYE